VVETLNELEQIESSLVPPNIEEQNNVVIVDNLNGIYCVSYVPYQKGEFLLHVTYKGENIKGSPFKVEVEEDQTEELKILQKKYEMQIVFSNQVQQNYDDLKKKYTDDLTEVYMKLDDLILSKNQNEKQLEDLKKRK